MGEGRNELDRKFWVMPSSHVAWVEKWIILECNTWSHTGFEGWTKQFAIVLY